MTSNESKIRDIIIEKVIVIEEVIGEGTTDKPLKIVQHYYSITGEHLFSK